MKKIDFAVVIGVDGCNPNGNPSDDNRPREDNDGFGTISDVCVKHKIRTCAHHNGENILYLNSGNTGYQLISANVQANVFKNGGTDEEIIERLNKTYFDVRLFGATLAIPSKNKEAGISVGIRGAFQSSSFKSISPIEIFEMPISKCVGTSSLSDTLGGCKYLVKRNFYVGMITSSIIEFGKNGVTEEDVEMLKKCIANMFLYDSTASRPEGTIWVADAIMIEQDSEKGFVRPFVWQEEVRNRIDSETGRISCDSVKNTHLF